MVGNKDNLDQESKRFLIEGTEKKAEELSIHLDNFFVKKENSEEENNRMFALYGGWGTGKTTLLIKTEEFLENNFEKLKTKNKYKIVWFKPWEYDNEGKDLDLKLLSKIETDLDIKNDFNDKFNTYKNKILTIPNIFLITIFLLINPISKFIYESLRSNGISNQIIFNFSLISLFLLIFIVLIYLKNVKLDIKKFFQILKNIPFNFSLGFVNISFDSKKIINDIRFFQHKNEEIQKKFSEILGDNKVIVFVDDLDRCQGETVLNLMEHIKHFYSVNDILFVFAIDQEKLAQYVVNKYGYKSNDNSMLIDKVTHIKYKQPDSKNDYDQYGYINNNFSLKEGYAYLDKFFPQSDRLSWSSEVKDFMRHLYKKNGIYKYIQEIENPIELSEDVRSKMLEKGIDIKDNKPLTLFQIEEMFFQCVEFYAWFNFRKIETLVNKFSTIYKKFKGAYFIYDKGIPDSEGILISIDQIFRLCLVEEFYPELLQGANSREKIIYSDILRYKVENDGDNRHLIKNPHMSIETIFKFKDIPDGNHTNGIINLNKKQLDKELLYDEFKFYGISINTNNSYLSGLFKIDTTTIEPINHDIVNRIDVLEDRTLLEKLKTIKCVSVK